MSVAARLANLFLLKALPAITNPLMKTLFFNISTDFQLLWLIDLTTKSALVQ